MNLSLGPVQDQPEDLSIQKEPSGGGSDSSTSPDRQHQGSSLGSPNGGSGDSARPKRVKPIPPPLDLNVRTFSPTRNISHGHASLAPLPPLILISGHTSPYHPKSPLLPSSLGFPSPAADIISPTHPWPSRSALTKMGLSLPFSPLPHSPLPFPSNTLSPAPSYHSYNSSGGSREDIPTSHLQQILLTAPQPHYGILPHQPSHLDSMERVSSSSPSPPSSLNSPSIWDHSWPTPVWQCFVSGVHVRFLLHSTDTSWQMSEGLGWKDKIAIKVDPWNPYHYAPFGLTVVKMDVITRSGSDLDLDQICKESGQEGEIGGPSEVSTLLQLRMSPHNVPDHTVVEMLAKCPLDHPFFVKDKGWSSAHPSLSHSKYGIPCQELSLGDVCLPLNHPDDVRTPNLCDRFRRFEFASHDLVDQFSPVGSVMSPPMSPASKKPIDLDKPKRPMNGFILFAKKFRLELTEQHLGKDNRAISVLLGKAWKGLQPEERDQYSQKAKAMADKQKKLYPNCWKRKRSL